VSEFRFSAGIRYTKDEFAERFDYGSAKGVLLSEQHGMPMLLTNEGEIVFRLDALVSTIGAKRDAEIDRLGRDLFEANCRADRLREALEWALGKIIPQALPTAGRTRYDAARAALAGGAENSKVALSNSHDDANAEDCGEIIGRARRGEPRGDGGAG
jgi:hypothetical protein